MRASPAKLLLKTSACRIAKGASPVEHVRLPFHQMTVRGKCSQHQYICSVKYNFGSSFHVVVSSPQTWTKSEKYYTTGTANVTDSNSKTIGVTCVCGILQVGSADHHIHYYDLRNITQPLHVFSRHRKSFSYVKFLSSYELASASTDNTLRLCDVKQNLRLRTFRGHVNEKNFVGLTVNSEYIVCGTETNEVFVYHKAISRPAALHGFSSDAMEVEEAGSYFTSAQVYNNDNDDDLMEVVFGFYGAELRRCGRWCNVFG
ncbi:hypothetical protein LXL04_020428 [Taraxacum kok-saghyz]